MAVFVKDPGRFLKLLEVELDCPVAPGRAAVLDSAHVARVNHELYFLSSAAARERFLADPLRWCGVLTDPVTGRRFRPGGRSPRADLGGRPYFFASRTSHERFLRAPERYADPMRKMEH